MAEEFSRGSTYRTLDEQEGRLSPAEERFERARRTSGLFLGPAAFVVMLLLPLGLTWEQHALAALRPPGWRRPSGGASSARWG